MPEEKKQQETDSTEEVESTEEQTEETKDEQSSEETEESTEETDESEEEDGDDEEELDLSRAKAKIAKANDEAKNLRARLRETEEKLKNAKTPEEFEAVVKQMTEDRESAEHELLRENVALKFKLPEKAIKRLAGKTREELEADAKELAELFGSEDDEDISLEGGLNPRDRSDEDPDDPAALAQKYGRRGKRR